MFKFFLWIIYILGNIRTVWLIKSWYSLKSLYFFFCLILSRKCPNTAKCKNIQGAKCPKTLKSKYTPGGKNVLIPPYCILLLTKVVDPFNYSIFSLLLPNTANCTPSNPYCVSKAIKFLYNLKHIAPPISLVWTLLCSFDLNISFNLFWSQHLKN